MLLAELPKKTTNEYSDCVLDVCIPNNANL